MQVRKLTPKHMRPGGGQRRAMHVTCAMFSSTSGEIVATYNDEVLPTSRAALPQALIHERNGIYGNIKAKYWNLSSHGLIMADFPDLLHLTKKRRRDL